MGIAERKEKQKLEIRKRILEASMKLFVEEGFSNVSIRRIADIIEYSPTTIYLYFKDKDEIFYNLHEMGFLKLQEMNRNLDDIHNPLLRLHKMGENYIQFGLENPEFYDLMFIQPEPMEKLTEMGCEWENGDAALTRLRDTLVECMEKGYIAKTDPTVLSLSIWSTVHGLVSLATRQRLEKLIPEKENVLPMIRQSLNWLINTLDISGKGK
ncbi:MAG: TetR family transcriptional regulator [Sphingobacteriales bacterium 50-39]|nr:TetR/AcrR family transcriptional regulator [Sphingobacteriales bacterium]OJW59032.1 MAG: TetR family transcriptional regulator [Sphingobacteriales bacterium 50-39]